MLFNFMRMCVFEEFATLEIFFFFLVMLDNIVQINECVYCKLLFDNDNVIHQIIHMILL